MEQRGLDIPDKDELIKKAGDLKVLPHVARKVLEMIGDENSPTSELSNLIEKDQTITARVLKISNSALYGLRQEVDSIQQAIMILGFRVLRSIVLSVSTRSLYRNPGIAEQLIWDHSVGAAIAAKLLSSGSGADLEEIAFVGGLMHDLGKVVMNNETPRAFSEVMMLTYNGEVDSLTAEEDIYGYNHTVIGSRVVAKWGFPTVLVEILEKHHLTIHRLEDIKDSLTARAIAYVNLADHVCRRLGIGFRKPDEALQLHKLPSAVFLGMDKERLDYLLKEIGKTYTTEKSIFQ